MNKDEDCNSESVVHEMVEEQVHKDDDDKPTPIKEAPAQKKKEDQLYRGKWTEEEEEYAYFLIEEFRLGNLSIPHGTTLRGYLAKKLDCAPKRISKKFENTGYNGKQHYNGKSFSFNAQEAEFRKLKLHQLKKSFLESRYNPTKKDHGKEDGKLPPFPRMGHALQHSPVSTSYGGVYGPNPSLATASLREPALTSANALNRMGRELFPSNLSASLRDDDYSNPARGVSSYGSHLSLPSNLFPAGIRQNTGLDTGAFLNGREQVSRSSLLDLPPASLHAEAHRRDSLLDLEARHFSLLGLSTADTQRRASLLQLTPPANSPSLFDSSRSATADSTAIVRIEEQLLQQQLRRFDAEFFLRNQLLLGQHSSDRASLLAQLQREEQTNLSNTSFLGRQNQQQEMLHHPSLQRVSDALDFQQRSSHEARRGSTPSLNLPDPKRPRLF